MNKPCLHTLQRNNKTAIAFMFGASALVAATSLLAKTLGIDSPDQSGLHPFQVSAGRFFFAFTAVLLFVIAKPESRPTFSGSHWRWHVSRSICGWLGVTAMFAAVARMPVSDATAISFLSPLVTMGFAALLLKEHLGMRKILAATLALTGAALILKPGTNAFQSAGLFALAAALFMGLEAIFIKRLSDSEPPVRVLLINNALGATFAILVASFFWTWPTTAQWSMMIALGTIMVCGQAMFIAAMRRSEASVVIPAFYSVLVFATGYDFILFNQFPHWSGLCGAALIVGGALFAARRNKNSDTSRA